MSPSGGGGNLCDILWLSLSFLWFLVLSHECFWGFFFFGDGSVYQAHSKTAWLASYGFWKKLQITDYKWFDIYQVDITDKAATSPEPPEGKPSEAGHSYLSEGQGTEVKEEFEEKPNEKTEVETRMEQIEEKTEIEPSTNSVEEKTVEEEEEGITSQKEEKEGDQDEDKVRRNFVVFAWIM